MASARGDEQTGSSGRLRRARPVPRAATCRSSNGITSSPIVRVVSWPLPAISTRSPSRAERTALAMAKRRSGSTIDLGGVTGCGPVESLAHGVDDRSRCPRAGCRRSELLDRRAEPPLRPWPDAWSRRGRRRHPNTTRDLPLLPASSRARLEELLEAIGGVGVVDHHGERLRRLDHARTGPARPRRRRARRRCGLVEPERRGPLRRRPARWPR